MITLIGVVEMVKAYHHAAYPEDGSWDDWYYSFAPIENLDAYVLLVKYRRPPGQGDLYSKITVDGLDLIYYECLPPELFERWVFGMFDKMRMEIIETLDGLQQAKEYGKKLMKSMIEPEFHFVETPPKTYEWKQYYIPIPKMSGPEFWKEAV